MSPSSSTSDSSIEESSEVNTPDSVTEGNERYGAPTANERYTDQYLQSHSPDSSLSEHQISLLSAEGLEQHNKNVEKKRNNDKYKAILLKRRTDGVSPFSDGSYATTAETPGGAGGAGGAGLKQMEQNSTVKSLANSLETGADTPVPPILKFLGGKVQAAGRGKIVTTLPISEQELQQARALLESEQADNAINNGKADNGAYGSGNGRASRHNTASKACTHAPNGYRWDHPLARHLDGSRVGAGGSSKSGSQRKRGSESEGSGSPTKKTTIQKDDTPATKTAQGMEKLHMVDTEIVGKPVTAAVDNATSDLEDGEIEIIAVVENQES